MIGPQTPDEQRCYDTIKAHYPEDVPWIIKLQLNVVNPRYNELVSQVIMEAKTFATYQKLYDEIGDVEMCRLLHQFFAAKVDELAEAGNPYAPALDERNAFIEEAAGL